MGVGTVSVKGSAKTSTWVCPVQPHSLTGKGVRHAPLGAVYWVGVGGSIWARVTSLARIEPREAGQLGSAAPLAHSLSRGVGVQGDVDVSSHAGGMGQSHKRQGPPCGWGRPEKKGCPVASGRGIGRSREGAGPALALDLGGRWVRGWHLQASLAEVGLGAGG